MTAQDTILARLDERLKNIEANQKSIMDSLAVQQRDFSEQEDKIKERVTILEQRIGLFAIFGTILLFAAQILAGLFYYKWPK